MKKEQGAINLDHLLCLWEDFCLIQNIRIQAKSIFGKVEENDLMRPLCGEEFRKYILEYKGGPIDFAKYIADYSSGIVASIPLSVLAWNHHSRRIFHLTSESQTLLDATSLGGIKWKDIKFPFESFLVTLEEPIIDSHGTEYDAILLAKIDSFFPKHLQQREDALIELRLLPTTLAEYKKFSKNEKRRIDVSLHNKNYEEILLFLEEFKRVKNYQTPTIHIFPEKLNDDVIKDSIPKLGTLTGQADMVKDLAIDSALHIALNLCLYLENYPPKYVPKKDKECSLQPKKRRKEKFDPNAISDELNIFTVKCHFNMTRAEIEQLVKEVKESITGEIRGSYWRRGHWRRKPYCGHIDWKIAPKDWIFSRIINPDRLPNNSLPPGSKATLL